MEGFLELGYVVERTVPPSAPTQDAHILIPGTWHKGIKFADRIKVDNQIILKQEDYLNQIYQVAKQIILKQEDCLNGANVSTGSLKMETARADDSGEGQGDMT